jgi:hypothetical protein
MAQVSPAKLVFLSENLADVFHFVPMKLNSPTSISASLHPFAFLFGSFTSTVHWVVIHAHSVALKQRNNHELPVYHSKKIK